MRLDRCLGNFQWIDAWSLLECSTLPRISSDHCPLLVSFSKLTITPKAPFRFHSMWLDHQDFFPLVEDVWKSSNFYGCPMYVLGAKLRVLKSRIKVWNKSVFGDVNMNVDKAFDALDEIQKEISSLGPSEERFTKEDNASLCVQNALIAQEKFYRDKSRIKWLSEGDNNTSFFHSMVKIRKLHRSLAVMRDGNRVLDNQMDISQHVITYFQDLFSADSSVTDTGLVARIIPKVVTATENESLLAIPTPDEIFETLKSMDHSSSPGPDGFGGSFYFRCWPIVGNDVVQAVQSFFSQGNILPHFNSNLMILIPKVDGANSVNHLRPIALANFSFKIITKILADRLSPIAAHIVSPQQNAFTKGRSIVDPIILTSECMNLLDRRCRGGNIAIKFDIRKAFDTLDWGFLLRVLDAFDFSAGFVDWIYSILTSAHLSVFINGSVEGFFPCSRGVRQGDPLSPILFCLAEEVFSRGLTRMVEADLIDTFSVPMGIAPPSHVLFADDIMVFMRGTKRSMRNLMRFVEEYSLNSGQCINKLKSLVFLGKYASSRHAIIQKVLGVSRGNLPFTYLGVPIFQGRPKRIYFQAIADKIRCKLTAWKGSLLSQAGRLQLINSVIQGILVYSFQIYAWPTNLLREVQGWIRNFFWSGDPLKRGMPLIAWSSCCKLKDEGGLGIRDLFESNRSLLLKRCWDVIYSSSPASDWLRNRFLKDNFHLLKSYKKSSIWLGLKQLWPSFYSSLQWSVGDGRKISFLYDNWLGTTLLSNIGEVDIIPLNSKVKDFIQDAKWSLPIVFTSSFPHLSEKIMKTPLPIAHMDDALFWTGSSSGTVSAKEAFLFFSSHAPHKKWAKMVWHQSIQPRKSLVVWKACHGRLLTDDLLQRRGVALASCCAFCHNARESCDHLLLHCPQTVALWKWIFILFGKPYDPWQCIEDIFYGSLVSSFPTSVRKLWLLVICNFFWWLWHKRNKIRFENKSFSIVESQRCLLRHWRESASTCFSSFTGCVSIPIFSMLRISSLSLDALNFVPVFWRPPPVGWIKINTDGSCKGNGHVGSGGVFRDSSGLFLGAFASSSSYPSAVVAEIVAVIEAIQIAWDKKWHNIWLETDSMHVISLLSAHSMDVPWFLKVSWANCLWHIARLNLRFSHIFREGNCLADAFANFGAMNSSFTWWDSVPDFADASYRRDCVGLPFFRSSS
ncbi:hypothetical protein ACFX2F_021920 [Malus domestica]